MGKKPRSRQLLTPTWYYILSNLFQPKDTIQIIEDVAAASGGQLELLLPTLYENLAAMKREGLIEAGPDEVLERGGRRKRFIICGHGAAVLSEEEALRTSQRNRNRTQLRRLGQGSS